MNFSVNTFKKHDLSFVLVLFPVALYILILIIPIPIPISIFFSQFSFTYFLLISALYYLSYRAKSKYAWLFSASVTALVFSMRLSYLWTSGHSGNMIIGGLLPFRDGFSYYSGANFLLDGTLIQNIAAWRPMFTSFVSSLLFLTQHNLMWSVAILVGLVGMSCYLSAYLILRDFGALAATIYMTFLYFYTIDFIGLLYTELLGLALGCLGFILVWIAAKSQNIVKLVVGLAVMMIAVSVRAGTFFIFPVLVLWAGWAFRKQTHFSFRTALIAFVTVSLTFLVVNSTFRLLIVEPGRQSFGNFAFTLYGQVVGGAGYNDAIQRFETRDSAIIYRAAWNFFLKHPLSFFIGAAKAYRDFFFSSIGVFRYYSSSNFTLGSHLVWITGLALTISGVIKAGKKVLAPVYSLLIAVFVGFLLSIPFLPPIDGGIRIYASSMPFFFGFLAIAFDKSDQKSGVSEGKLLKTVETLSVLVIILILIVPVFIQRLSAVPSFDIPLCPPDQVPYVVELHQGSFIDVLPDEETSCGHAPRICASDFQDNSLEMLTDASDAQVYQVLIDNGVSTGNGIRVFVGNDLVSKNSYLFTGSASTFQQLDNGLISGCATVKSVKKRPDILQIETGEILK